MSVASFIASIDRYTKAPARRCLTQIMPMSPDAAKVLNLPGLQESTRHIIIERLVADGASIVQHSERELRGSTMHISIGQSLTIPAKPGAALSLADVGKYGIAYAAHLGAITVADEE